MRTRYFHETSAHVHFSYMQSQIMITIGGIGALGAHLIFYSNMDSLDVHIHILLATKCLITLVARESRLGLGIGLATSSPH